MLIFYNSCQHCLSVRRLPALVVRYRRDFNVGLRKKMADMKLQAIILAAGKSTRFNSDTSKLLTPLCGQELILYPVALFAELKIPITIVIGYQKDAIIELINKKYTAIEYAEQQEHKGTGHAVLSAKNFFHAENILVMNGDMPLVNTAIIDELVQEHTQRKAAVTFVTADNADPSLSGYGRVIKEDNKIEIIEDRHFTGDKTTQYCINAGIYIFKRDFLEKSLDQLQENKQSRELYITDIIKLANITNNTITTVDVPFDKVRGINTLKELWIAEQIKRAELIEYWMQQGVYFPMAHTVHLDLDVTIGRGTRIGAGVQLLNGTSVGSLCSVEPYCILKNASLNDNVTLYAHSIVTNAEIHAYSQVGPFAHVHSATTIKQSAQIGNFVEISRTTIGQESKAKHLTFLGDATIGSKVNIGAGTITCNYNGVSKHKTVIGDETHIGSNNSLVAPLHIGSAVITGAGSTINHNVPDNALAIARAMQVTKENYAAQLKERYVYNQHVTQSNTSPQENVSEL